MFFLVPTFSIYSCSKTSLSVTKTRYSRPYSFLRVITLPNGIKNYRNELKYFLLLYFFSFLIFLILFLI